MPTIGYAHRPVAYGTRGLVASAHALGTLAGIDVLRAGGNAVDAAVAVNAVLAVVQPHMCGVGGDLFCLLYDAPAGEVVCLNGAGRSGSAATLEVARARGWSAVPLVGAPAVSVPGVVDAWGALLARYGSRPLAALIEPAIALAADGFPASDLLVQTIAERRSVIGDAEWHRIFVPAGRLPAPGGRLRQTDLAATLTRIAKEGSRALYEGELATRIARHLATGGGFVSTADLAAHASCWPPPIQTTYRGAVVYQTPPPTQGLTVLEGLNLLEGFELPPLHTGEHLHLLVEAVKLAYADRERFIGDPDHVTVPVADLLDKAYAARRRARFDRRRAATGIPCGDPSGDTTGFVVADAGGSVLAVIQSVYSAFGSGVVPPGTGIVLHSRGAGFSLDPASPSVLAPRKQPFHTLIAALVTRDDRPTAALATMGAHGQPQTHLQLLTNLLDFGLDPQEAIERPRFVQGRMRHTDADDRLRIESRVAPRTVAALRRRGHPVDVVDAWATTMGQAHVLTVRADLEGPVLAGGADPRGDGLALGY